VSQIPNFNRDLFVLSFDLITFLPLIQKRSNNQSSIQYKIYGLILPALTLLGFVGWMKVDLLLTQRGK